MDLLCPILLLGRRTNPGFIKLMENNIQKERKHVTVLMPVYNNQAHVAHAIESILEQTYLDLDLVIVDDFSTDSTRDIIQGFALVDDRVRIIFNTENLGIPETRNILLDNISSDSKYFAILDGDDIADPERIERQVKFIEEKEIDGCGSNLRIIDGDGNQTGTREYPLEYSGIKNNILHFNPFAQSSMLIKAEVLDEVGGYDEKLERVQDYDLWIRIIKKGFVLENMKEKLTSFRVHENQGKTKNSKKSFWYSFVVRSRYLFSKEFFSLKGFMIWLAYIPMVILPASVTVGLYKKLFVKNEKRQSE